MISSSPTSKGKTRSRSQIQDKQIRFQKTRLSKYQSLVHKLDTLIGRIAAIRFVGFLIGSSCTFSAIYDRNWSLYGPIALGGWLVFLIALLKHRTLYDLLPRAQKAAELCQITLDKVSQNWKDLIDDGSEYLSGEPIERELHLFGSMSLYQLMSSAQLRGSRDRLAHLLKNALYGSRWSTQELEARQSSAQALTPLHRLRLSRQTVGRETPPNPQREAGP